MKQIYKITVEHPDGRTITRNTEIVFEPAALEDMRKVAKARPGEALDMFQGIVADPISFDVEEMIAELVGVLPPEVPDRV